MSQVSGVASPNFDESIQLAVEDRQTTEVDGSPIVSSLEGVVVRNPIVHNDHRGRVFEIYQGEPGEDLFWAKPVVYSYVFTIRPGQVKGWGLHQHKDDRYSLIAGEVLTILYDARVDSTTHRSIQRVVLSEQGARQLLIPTGVWHMNVNIGDKEVHLVNHPTEKYAHERPDRLLLPWDSPGIPFELSDVFPIQR